MPCWLRWCDKPEAELGAALDRLIAAGLLFRQGVPPHATYLFKHALVQDAAYGTLLREPRRALHARIAETLESQFAEMTETRPELLARQCAEAGLIEKAAGAVGQSRTAIIGALRADRSGRAVYARPRPSRVLACNARAAPRTDQASGRACERSVSYQGHGGGRNKSGVRSSPRNDRASGKIRRARRRPAPAVLRPLRLLHSEVYQLRRRCCMRACAPIPCTRRAAKGDGPYHDWTSFAGQYLAVYGRCCRRALTSRSCFGALRPGRASPAGDAIWPRCGSGYLTFGHWLCGCSVIPRQPWWKPTVRSTPRARPTTASFPLMTDAVENSKMNRPNFSPVRTLKPVFGTPTLHRDLTKAAGWKSG